jgi:hypothetical protein
VTKTRYSIEIVNGKLKKFRLLDETLETQSLPTLEKNYKIAAALLNKFFVPVISDQNDFQSIINRISERLTVANELADEINEKNWNRVKKGFTTINESSIGFPKLTDRDLKLLTVGTYQLKQAKAYAIEQIATIGSFTIQKHETESICRMRLQSRHRTAKQYYPYVKYDSNEDGLRAIHQYACNCHSGRRTVGMCSHTTCLIWYLSSGQYSDIPKTKIKYKEMFNDHIVMESDSSSDEEG